jgi:hypothetical protein
MPLASPRFFASSLSTWFTLSALPILFVVLAFALATSGCGRGGISDAELLPVEDYLKKPGDFLGNRYRLRVQIDEQIKWEKGLGRVLAVRMEGASARLPVFIPEGVTENLHVGQRYEMEAIVEQGGLIYVEALHKY